MEPGQAEPKRDPRHLLSVPEVAPALEGPQGPTTNNPAWLQIHDTLEFRRDTPSPRPAAPLPSPEEFESRRDRGAAQTGNHPAFAAPGPVEARPDRVFPSPTRGSFLTPPAHVEVHAATSPPIPRDDASTPPASKPVEVRRDQPERSTLPPFAVDADQIEIQANAGRQKVRVMTTGVFDLIHIGHIKMLEAARALGDELVVVIARDETVRRMKHEPINGEELRRQIVSALKPVGKAVLGNTGDIYRIVPDLRPDIIALGHDQKFSEDEVRRRCAELGVNVKVVRLPEFEHDLDATRKIIDRIGQRLQKNQLYQSG